MAAVHFSKRSMHAQQVPRLPLILVYIVLCREVCTTAPERSCDLNDCQTKTPEDRSV